MLSSSNGPPPQNPWGQPPKRIIFQAAAWITIWGSYFRLCFIHCYDDFNPVRGAFRQGKMKKEV